LKSVKERVKLRRTAVSSFMQGELDVTKEFQRYVDDGLLEEKAAGKAMELAIEMQKMIVAKQLKPKIRTSYHRTAFQQKSSNQVRLSLDYPLYLFEETAATQPGGPSVDDFWSQLDAPCDVQPFNFGVLEVKTVGDEQPQWVNELLATGWIQEIKKFSKFQHAIATCFPTKVKIMPYWLSEVHVNAAPAPAPAGDADVGYVVVEEADLGDTGLIDAVAIPVATANSDTDARETAAMLTQETALPTARQRGARGSAASVDVAGAAPVQRRPRQAAHVEIKSTNLTRAKIEPKTYFANERTFIQWLSAALLIITLSAGMMAINDTGRIIGTLFFPIGAAIVIYALVIFHWRRRKIGMRDPGRYDDGVGPTVLATALLCVMVATLSFTWVQEAERSNDPSSRRRRGGAEVDLPSAALWNASFVDTCTAIPPMLCGHDDPAALDAEMFSVRWNPKCFATHTARARSSDLIIAALDQLSAPSSPFYQCADVAAEGPRGTRFSVQDVAAPQMETRLCSASRCVVRVGGHAQVDSRISSIRLERGLPPRRMPPWVSGSWEYSDCDVDTRRFAYSGSHRGWTEAEADAVTAALLGGAPVISTDVAHVSTYSRPFRIGGAKCTVDVRTSYQSASDSARGMSASAAEVQVRVETGWANIATREHAATVQRFLKLVADEASC